MTAIGGSFPHDPETVGDMPSWHTRFGKIRSCATSERSNTEICTVELKIQLYGEIVSGRKYIPHSQSPLNVSIHIYIPHSHSKENICARWRNANSFEENVVCDCSLIQHSLFLETVALPEVIAHGILSITVSNIKNYLAG